MPAKVVTWQSGGYKISRLVAFHWNASLEISENAIYTLSVCRLLALADSKLPQICLNA